MFKTTFSLRHAGFGFLGLTLLSACASMPAISPNMTAATPLATAEPTATPVVEAVGLTLVAGGDVLPGAFLNPYLAKNGPGYPYEHIAPYFQSAQVGLVNLECPLSTSGQRFSHKKFTFRADPQAAQAMKQAGINAVALANNHIMDFGLPALQDTLTSLETAGIVYTGAGLTRNEARKPAVITIAHGPTVAMLSYSLTYPDEFWAGAHRPGTAYAQLKAVEEDINSANAWADVVIVSYHWGAELMRYPKGYQRQFAHASIDAGADVVIGTHPHVLQGMEFYKDKLILYSLGNLAFGGGRSKRAVDSALVKLIWDSSWDRFTVWVLPLNVDNLDTAFMPAPMDGAHGQQLLAQLKTLSQAWGITYGQEQAGWTQVLQTAPNTVKASRTTGP